MILFETQTMNLLINSERLSMFFGIGIVSLFFTMSYQTINSQEYFIDYFQFSICFSCFLPRLAIIDIVVCSFTTSRVPQPGCVVTILSCAVKVNCLDANWTIVVYLCNHVHSWAATCVRAAV